MVHHWSAPRGTAPGAGRFAPALVALLLLLAASAAHAQLVIPKTLSQMVDEAEQIFVGTVTAVQSSQPPGRLISTYVTFAVDRVVKGDVLDPFVLRHAGGTVNGVTLRVGGAPEFAVDTRYVVFVKGNGRAGIPLSGGEQGLFRVVAPPAGGPDVVQTARGGPLTNAAVFALPATPESALAGPVRPLTLPVFLDAIGRALAR